MEWIRNNLVLYTVMVVLVVVLICWLLGNNEYLASSMVRPSFKSAHTQTLLDSVKRKQDGMTVIDLELEKGFQTGQFT